MCKSDVKGTIENMTGKVVSTPFDAIGYKVIGYLAVSACPLGLLINFGERSLSFRRIFPPKKVINDLANRQWLFVPEWLKNDPDRG